MQNRSIKLNSPPKLCCINWSEKWPLIKQININIAIAGMTVELQMAEWCDAGLSRTNSSQAKWIRVRKLKAGWKSWDFQERLIVYMQQNDPNHRLFIAGFDWPPALSLGKNLGPPQWRLCLRLCAPTQAITPSSMFSYGNKMREERQAVDGEGGGCHVKKSFWCCFLQFRLCSVPTQIKTFPVAYVNMLPTALRFNEPWYERHLKPMENNWPLKGGVHVTGDR